MKITYGITVCNENEELTQLLDSLHSLIEEEDEIIVLRDLGKTTPSVARTLNHFKTLYNGQLKLVESYLNNDFASFKNQLLNEATGDYLFQIEIKSIRY